jgi:hypothetical protein
VTGAQALPLSLSILMLYGDMEKLTKLHVSIFALLTSTDCNSKFINMYVYIYIENCLKICQVYLDEFYIPCFFIN